MNTPENKSEGNNKPAGNPPTKEPEVTHIKIVESKKLTIANCISIGLLCVSLGLAIVNLITYRGISKFNVQTIDNYKIRNRPFVKIKPISILNKEQKDEKTTFKLKLEVKNFGQFPAFIDETYIWIENISDDSKGLPIWKQYESYAIERFALFQNEPEPFNLEFLLGNDDKTKIKKLEETENRVYFVFFIKYNTLGVEEGLQDGPFYYWAKYRCNKKFADPVGTESEFLIEECGDKDKIPTSNLPQDEINTIIKKREEHLSGKAKSVNISGETGTGTVGTTNTTENMRTNQ